MAQEVAGQATTLDELNGVMRSLMKTALEKMLNAELEVHLGRGSNAATAALAVVGSYLGAGQWSLNLAYGLTGGHHTIGATYAGSSNALALDIATIDTQVFIFSAAGSELLANSRASSLVMFSNAQVLFPTAQATAPTAQVAVPPTQESLNSSMSLVGGVDASHCWEAG